MKLKTLKNMDCECWGCGEYCKEIKVSEHEDNEAAVAVKDLQAEAVKWIKELRFGLKLKNITWVGGDYTEKRVDAITRWIKHFFQIDEEMLK